MWYHHFVLAICFKAMLVHGFGFQMMPFQMDISVPSSFSQSPIFPSSPMNMMSFPPVFNPMEAMDREVVGDPDVRGIDVVDSPAGNITTKNKTETKDGFKVTTITSDGPGFHSYIKEYESESKNGTGGNSTGKPGKMIKMPNIMDIIKEMQIGMRRKKKKCKKCGPDKFCDPIFHLCRKKFAEGRTCMVQKQCGKNLRCQWGKCQKAKKGDPGTFCKGNSDCNGDACCRNTPGSFHLMCIPQQSEGAICGLHERTESVAKMFYIVKRSVAPSCSPCRSGLKCADTGDPKHKHCVKKAFVEKAADELEDDNPSNGLDEDKDDDDDDSSGDNEKTSAAKKVKAAGVKAIKWQPGPGTGDIGDKDDDEDDKSSDKKHKVKKSG